VKIAGGSKLTDAGRVKPIGEGGDSLGSGYVSYVGAMIGAVYPERRIRVVNMGIGGNTIRDLKSRWQTDVLDLQPNWLSIMIGINDVGRQFDGPLYPDAGVPLDEYEATLDELIVRTAPMLQGLVLMTPFYMESRTDDAMRALTDKYGSAMGRVAAKHQALLVDSQALFDSYLEHYYSAYLGWDRVHPSSTGHMLLARGFLKAIGCAW